SAVPLIGIARASQLAGNFLDFDLLAHLKGVWRGINAGRVAEHRTLETLVNHPAKLYVVIGKGSTRDGGEDQKHHQGNFQHRIAGERTFSGLPRLRACRDLKFYGHKLERRMYLCYR